MIPLLDRCARLGNTFWPLLRPTVCLAVLAATVIGRATTVLPPTFAELVNESDYIVRAVVKSVKCEYRANSSGRGRKIITKVEVDVREIVAGTPPKDLVLEMLGGRIGDDEMFVDGAPQFAVGDENILFVSGNGHTVSPLFRMRHGQYHVQHEKTSGRRFVERSNHRPLQTTAEVAQPFSDGDGARTQPRQDNPAQALTPDQFIQAIRAAVDPAYSHEKLK